MKLSDLYNKEFSVENYQEIISKIEDYVEGINPSYYTKNRNVGAETLKNNHATGKAGEAGVAYHLATQGWPAIEPDYTIYEGNQKTWTCDLPYSSVNPNLPDIAVKTCDEKTCSFVRRNRPTSNFSWTFQYKNAHGNGGTDELFTSINSKELVIFTYVSHWRSNKHLIYAVLPWVQVKPLLQDPIAVKYKDQKLCLYSDTLEEYFRTVES